MESRRLVNLSSQFIACFVLGIFAQFLLANRVFAAMPASGAYKLQDYGMGAGGANNTFSAAYAVNGMLGQVDVGSPSSSLYNSRNGLEFLQTSSVPPRPTFTNPSNFYNKLNMTLNTIGNFSDTVYAIAMSPNAFASTTQYVQADDTLGNTPVWQTNAVWGSSGFTVIGLTPGATYTAKVSSKQGKFTQSPYGPTVQAATVTSTFSFSLSPNSVSIGSLTASTVITAGTTITATMSTNANGGGVIYVYDTNAGLLSSTQSYTISAVSGDLTALSEGYGIQGSSPSQSAGGPMQVLSPYNGATNNVGIVDTSKRPLFDSTSQPVTSGQAVFSIKAKAGSSAKPATDYADTIRVIASATF